MLVLYKLHEYHKIHKFSDKMNIDYTRQAALINWYCRVVNENVRGSSLSIRTLSGNSASGINISNRYIPLSCKFSGRTSSNYI
jgi:hypothetical protein